MKRPDTFEFAHIDADEIIYQAGHSSQRNFYCVYIKGAEADGWISRFRYKKDATEYCKTWLGGLYYPDPKTGADCGGWGVLVRETEHDPEHKALGNAKAYMDSIMVRTKAKASILYFSWPKNFRHARATIKPYKDNRPEKPKHYQAIKDFLQRKYQWYVVKDLEADDCLGIQGFKSWQEGSKDIIVTNDKDLNMIPGWRYVPYHREIRYVDIEDGDEAFAVQILTGDSTDTIPSFKHITGKVARKPLKDWVREGESLWEMWCRVWYLFWENSDMTEEETTAVVWELSDLLWMVRFKSNGKFLSYLRGAEGVDEFDLQIFKTKNR